MTSMPPDPEPDETASVEPSGTVDPGDTPPASGQGSGVSGVQTPSGQRLRSSTRSGLVAVATVIGAFVVIAVLLVLYLTGAFS